MVENTPLWPILDRIRETQISHTALLQELIAGHNRIARLLDERPLKKSSGATQKFSSFSKLIGVSGVQYAVGLAMMAYIVRGEGDILTLLKLLLAL